MSAHDARAAAEAEGSSRNAYIVEVLTEHARRVRPVATAETLRQAADLAADLGDETLMHAAWLAPLLEANATPRSEAVTMEIMAALVAARLQRSVPLPAVMIASIAVVDRLTVLHDDRDFDRIREVYGAPFGERLSP